MNEYLYNISGGNPSKLRKPIIAAIIDGIAKILPAIIIVDIFNTMYLYFAGQHGSLHVNRLWIDFFILFIWLFVSYFSYASLYDKTYRSAYEVAASGRLSLAEHIRRLSLGFYGVRDPGEISNLLLSDYARVEHTISHNVPQLISAIILPIIAFLGLLFIDWRMAVAMFIAIPFGIALLWVTDSMQARLSEKHVTARNQAASRLEEYLLGIREIKAHNLGGNRFERLRKAFNDLMQASIRLESIMGSFILGAMLLIRSGMSLMILVGSFLLVDGTLTLPVFLLFLLVGIRVYEPLTVVLINYGEIRYSAYSAKRIMNIHQEIPLGGDLNMSKELPIHFENVTFAYETDQPVVKNVSLTIPPNTMTALVGPSGSGKSTIVKLIARFWDINEGTIKIGDQPVTSIAPESLLKDMSMVFQDVYLFNDTIENNIRIGKMDATKEEIENAAKRARCHDFITKLPQGYQTIVAEGGSTLSGGEKQRISIARALLKDASIILLDEATSSLDPENELAVQEAINELVVDKTVIIIAHRLKTVQHADQIIVLEAGEIIEKGNHEDLMRVDGPYRKLWDLQQFSEGWRLQQ